MDRKNMIRLVATMRVIIALCPLADETILPLYRENFRLFIEMMINSIVKQNG